MRLSAQNYFMKHRQQGSSRDRQAAAGTASQAAAETACQAAAETASQAAAEDRQPFLVSLSLQEAPQQPLQLTQTVMSSPESSPSHHQRAEEADSEELPGGDVQGGETQGGGAQSCLQNPVPALE
ncbi:uncharacterized protein [Dendrobates tinctorius]|uniref:uncharacterized protein isoform X2 n=1 Tax=Dendrobates tinctorius TaxID=92724 RepID=UPI003CC9C3FE